MSEHFFQLFSPIHTLSWICLEAPRLYKQLKSLVWVLIGELRGVHNIRAHLRRLGHPKGPPKANFIDELLNLICFRPELEYVHDLLLFSRAYATEAHVEAVQRLLNLQYALNEGGRVLNAPLRHVEHLYPQHHGESCAELGEDIRVDPVGNPACCGTLQHCQ